MKQRTTRELFEYWDGLRGGRSAPDRADLVAGAIRSCLADTFVLAPDRMGNHRFRIAGTAICALFGRELSRTGFEPLWHAGDARAVTEMVRRVVDDADGAVGDVTGRNVDDEVFSLEMIVLPLTCAGEGAGRILGALTAVSPPYWVGLRPLQALRLGEWRHLKAAVPLGDGRHSTIERTARRATL